MTTRRKFIQIVPFAGAALLVGCGDKAATPKVAEQKPATPAPAPAPATPAPAAPAPAPAATAPAAGGMLDEKDATASSLGYVADASRVDGAKFKNFVAGSNCGNCVQYQGAAGSESGACTIFPGKQVAAKGWCTAYAKKA